MEEKRKRGRPPLHSVKMAEPFGLRLTEWLLSYVDERADGRDRGQTIREILTKDAARHGKAPPEPYHEDDPDEVDFHAHLGHDPGRI